MATNYFLVLGLPETADASAIDKAYQALCSNLAPSRFGANKAAEAQAETALTKVKEAYAALRSPEAITAHAEEVKAAGEPIKPDQLKPFIGHLCVAAGIIEYGDLVDAISKQTDIDLPLGQILQERCLITQTELEGMLMGQKLYGAPTRPLETTVKRLLALGVVNIDMVKIVVIDQRTAFGVNTDDLLVKRGYVQRELVEALKEAATAS